LDRGEDFVKNPFMSAVSPGFAPQMKLVIDWIFWYHILDHEEESV